MAFPKALREQLVALDLPEDRIVRARVEQFLIKSGYTVAELGERTGVGRVSLGLYLSGRYTMHHPAESNTLLVRAKLTSYLDSLPADAELRPLGALYYTASYTRIRKAFYRALEHGWAYVVDGAPGTQKSNAAERLVRELAETEVSKNGHGRRAYYIYCREHEAPLTLLRKIAIEAGIPARGYVDQLLKKLEFELGRRRALLVLDEAQHLTKPTLEVVRQLLDRPPYFGILMMGSHNLQKSLSDLRMEQWRRRAPEVMFLTGLSREEAETIIAGEFGRASKKQVELLVESSIVPDFRWPIRPKRDSGDRHYPFVKEYQGQKFEAYLSAGALFSAIEQAKMMRSEQQPESVQNGAKQ